jgi:3'(2'), 5'-bisphosphate nucleotidase
LFKLPIGVDINNLIDDLRFFSWEASDILLHYSKRLKNQEYSKEIIKTKSKLEPVTIADIEVNDLIIKRINKNYKEVAWNILSEENVKTGDDIFVANSQWIWILDPLDGTKDFIQGTENYAMHLALNYDKKPYIGLVLIPEKGELWITDSKDTWCEKKDGSIRKASCKDQKTLQEMTIVTSKNHKNPTLNKLINKVGFSKVNVM